MNYGEVQGPINKEPEEKLDPSIKPNSTSSGIRRLYVLTNINNLLNVELVVIYNCCLNILPLNDLCLKQAANNTTCLKKELENSSGIESTNDDHSKSSTPSSTSQANSKFSTFKFSLLILLFVYYLFICFYMNKFLVNLFNLVVRLVVNYDLVIALIVLNLYKSSKKHKLVFSMKKHLLSLSFNKLINLNIKCCFCLFTICCFFYIIIIRQNSSLMRLLRS